MKTSDFALATTLAAPIAFASAVHAAEIYATDHLWQYPGELDTDALIVFDSANPAGFEMIGEINVPGIGFGGLDFDEEGNLWAYASFYQFTGGAASGLYKIDPETGTAAIQGTLSLEILQDISYNPVDKSMYGINTLQGHTSNLYEIDLETGFVEPVGEIAGLPTPHALIGMAYDSAGYLYIHDQTSNAIYKSGAPGSLSVSLLYQFEHNTIGSQGMTIDWSRDDMGYHGFVAQGEFPNYIVQINTFATDGSAYVYGEEFGPTHEDGVPLVQPGDLAIRPDSSRPTTPGDLDGNGVVDVFDLLALLAEWGACPGAPCPADLDGNGEVDVFDLLELLANWD